jgi:hypothetical protein
VSRYLLAVAMGLTTMASGYTLGFESGPTHHSGRLDTNELWHPSGNPHILDGDVYTGDSVTLAIMPGCTVHVSAGAELYTGYANPGSVIAVGKADSMITFTSLSDTVPGFWNSISFYDNTISTAQMSYCNVLFGGKAGYSQGAVCVEGTSIRFDHNLIRKSGSYGVWISNTGYFGDFNNNTITGCTKRPVRIAAGNVPTLGTGNALTGNVKNGIEVTGSDVENSGTWLNHDVPYVLTDDVSIDNNAVVTIEAGCIIALDADVELYCGYASPGGLIADGTSDTITFTSSRTSPSAGDWRSLAFYANSIDSQCRLRNCKVEYAGSHGYGNIYIDNCTPTITGCDIGYSSAYGIYLNGSEYPDAETLRANNTIHDYVSGDIRVPGVGITETPLGPVCATEPPTTVRGVLLQPGATGDKPQATCLLDISGRKVLDLRPGANDVRALAPGVYFVREAQAQAQTVRKVVISR